MNELFKFYTLREFKELTPEEINKFGLKSHPNDNTSQWFKGIIKFCDTKDYRSLVAMAVEYLKSDRAIYSLDQLDSDASRVIKWLEFKGNNFTIEEISEVIDLRQFKDYFSKKKDCHNFNFDFQRVADTYLSIGILRELGNKHNLDYQQILRGLHLIDTVNSQRKKILLGHVHEILDKPVMVPHCFFAINRCTKKLEKVEPFSYFNFGKLESSASAEKEKFVSKTKSKERKNVPPLNKDCNCDEKGQGDCDCSCTCCCDETCKNQNTCCAGLTPFVTDLMVVKEELKCYEAKHIAYIENIMLGENRERNHRHLERTEEFTETETIVKRSEEKDHQVSERFSLKTETNNTIQSDVSREAGVKIKAFGAGYKVTKSLNASAKLSKSSANKIAREYARDVVDRAVTKVEESVRGLKSFKQIIETEETNVHTFENFKKDPLTDKHLIGQYHFVNMISKAQVLNYGKRMMFEFILPEPMELYKMLVSKELEKSNIKKPESPEIEPKQISDVLDKNNPNDPNFYLNLAKKYDISDLESPPPVSTIIGTQFKFIQPGNTDFSRPNAEAVGKALTVPPNYFVETINVNGGVTFADRQRYEHSGNTKHMRIIVSAGSTEFEFNTSKNKFNESKNSILKEKGELPVAIDSWGAHTYAIAIEGVCKRTKESFEAWQLKIFGKIMAAYETKLQAYNAELQRAKQKTQAKHGSNFFINRKIEETELKRMAISYLSCQFYDRFAAMKRNVKPCGLPQMDLEQAERDGLFIQFFEHLIDWELMTYVFYPYFWGDKKCGWAEKIQTQTGDSLFDQALSAGAARVQIPVKLGFEPLAMHWVAFGEIWQGTGQPPLPGSPYYISMAQEIKEQKGHYYVDRKGTLDVRNGVKALTLNNSDYYWDFGAGSVNQINIDNDTDREIIIDCVVYRIVSIQEIPDPNHDKWTIELDKEYEGVDNPNIKFQTGAIFIGAPFEVTVPTNLVYLRNDNQSDCLPSFPLPKCQ